MNIKIKKEEKSKFGGRLIAYYGNQAVGWLRYHIDFDDAKMITVSLLEVKNGFDYCWVKEELLSYLYKEFSLNGYTITYNYNNS